MGLCETKTSSNHTSSQIKEGLLSDQEITFEVSINNLQARQLKTVDLSEKRIFKTGVQWTV